MPIPLGVLAVAGAGAAGAAGAYELLETISVGTAVASVSFSNLDTNYGSIYQHLQIRSAVRTSRAGPSVDDLLRIRFNSDSGNNYSHHALAGNGTSVTSGADTNTSGCFITYVSGSADTANAFTGVIADFLDAFESTKYTTMRYFAGPVGGGDRRVILGSNAWRNTAAVTTIAIDSATSSNLSVGSRFSLYGLRSA